MGMVLQNIYNLPNLFENYEFFTCKCYIVTPRPTYVGKYISYQKKKPWNHFENSMFQIPQITLIRD